MAALHDMHPSTIEPALPALETDVFRGYLEDDPERIRAIMPTDTPVDPTCFTDAMGVKVSLDYCPWIWDRTGVVETRIPIPTDTYLGEAIEYVGFAMAVEKAAGRDTLTIVELGAGWGPWVSLGSVNAHRLGFPKARIVAFEADGDRYNALRQHLALNSIVPADAPAEGEANGYQWKLLHAAAHWEDSTLYWPAESNVLDAGMAAITDPEATNDYRGQPINTIEVKAIGVIGAIAHLDIVDFMHIDIQGGEEDLLPRIIDALEPKVRVLFLGTHSRKIEGDFIKMLGERGWDLFRERPCQFYPMSDAPTLVGRTYMDGAQLWLNTRL